jgi:hypothetical protein
VNKTEKPVVDFVASLFTALLLYDDSQHTYLASAELVFQYAVLLFNDIHRMKIISTPSDSYYSSSIRIYLDTKLCPDISVLAKSIMGRRE